MWANRIKSLWTDKKIRFLIIGGLNTGVGFVVFPTLYYLLTDVGVGYMTLLIASQIICTNFSFLTNKSMVFKSKGSSVLEYFKYNTFQTVVIVLNIFVLPFCVEVIRINPVIAQTVYTGIVVVVSYFWHSNITFSERA